MNTMALSSLAEGLDTTGFQGWIINNIIPLLLLLVALLLLWMGGSRGDHAGVMKRLGGVFIALGIIGLAVTGAGVDIGAWIAGLFNS